MTNAFNGGVSDAIHTQTHIYIHIPYTILKEKNSKTGDDSSDGGKSMDVFIIELIFVLIRQIIDEIRFKWIFILLNRPPN